MKRVGRGLETSRLQVIFRKRTSKSLVHSGTWPAVQWTLCSFAHERAYLYLVRAHTCGLERERSEGRRGLQRTMRVCVMFVWACVCCVCVHDRGFVCLLAAREC